ncbi:hypothetical protein MGG_10033 [Pyricularia oryzae 70-15]|uniref:AB hydrolase-1 domain-containing protein n=3 Tax=Pyricularia oryzae TaxID=318829 RepID=G4N9B1_PYRO7|nr:uncharacterized protein MGG_10033 [Pyricularia oryzae 70-15]EHA51152.1 hypothetical protein MGG_10033 [Pyricularia oryzae 70-15]ELQ35202.1 hypothetical protein OOU_Y34scaffold00722g8 [Pyricularia oryzae Y34]KAI7910500.1 hypothetical protein M9X92_011062 [Pyricularia oryzae]KAI7911588.1 hypothetical protein M0657_010864 [Pyricularia oryzae]
MSPHHVDLRQEQPRPAASGATGDHSGQRPVIVIIPGAWHHPVHYNLLAKGLRQLGFEFEVVELSTMGEPEAIVGKTHHDDVKIVRDAIQPHLDAGREVVLVPHSYGGFVATDVAAGCTVEERRDAAGGDDGLEVGGRGGVKAVVYMASPVTSEKGVGLTAACELVRGEYPILIEGFVNVEEDVSRTTDESWRVLYHGVDEKLAKEAFAATSRHHSSSSFISEAAAGGRDLRTALTYVITGEEKFILSPTVQHRIADSLGPRCTKQVLEGSGHAPWMQPELLPRLLDIIEGAAQG